MQTAFLDQLNILALPIVAKASGNAITSGAVNFYLVDKDGSQADKWYRGSDTSWQVAEAIAGAATHRVDGHWYLSFPSAVWRRSVRYRFYAKEGGNLHIPVGEDIICVEPVGGPLASANTYTVLDGDSNPIEGVDVWVTTDIEGTNTIRSGTTDSSGKVTFYLDAGITYYYWSQKDGYNFVNPDTEIAI